MNITNQTGDITNSAVANVSFPSSCSTKSGAFNFHSCTNVNIIFSNNADKQSPIKEKRDPLAYKKTNRAPLSFLYIINPTVVVKYVYYFLYNF